jgi:hypothetical protein
MLRVFSRIEIFKDQTIRSPIGTGLRRNALAKEDVIIYLVDDQGRVIKCKSFFCIAMLYVSCCVVFQHKMADQVSIPHELLVGELSSNLRRSGLVDVPVGHSLRILKVAKNPSIIDGFDDYIAANSDISTVFAATQFFNERGLKYIDKSVEVDRIVLIDKMYSNALIDEKLINDPVYKRNFRLVRKKMITLMRPCTDARIVEN